MAFRTGFFVALLLIFDGTKKLVFCFFVSFCCSLESVRERISHRSNEDTKLLYDTYLPIICVDHSYHNVVSSISISISIFYSFQIEIILLTLGI